MSPGSLQSESTRLEVFSPAFSPPATYPLSPQSHPATPIRFESIPPTQSHRVRRKCPAWLGFACSQLLFRYCVVLCCAVPVVLLGTLAFFPHFSIPFSTAYIPPHRPWATGATITLGANHPAGPRVPIGSGRIRLVRGHGARARTFPRI